MYRELAAFFPRKRLSYRYYRPEVLKKWGTILLLGGGANLSYEGHIYFERYMGTGQNIYFDRHFAWLKYLT
jgi:hypothetical protein